MTKAIRLAKLTGITAALLFCGCNSLHVDYGPTIRINITNTAGCTDGLKVAVFTDTNTLVFESPKISLADGWIKQDGLNELFGFSGSSLFTVEATCYAPNPKIFTRQKIHPFGLGGAPWFFEILVVSFQGPDVTITSHNIPK